MSEPSVQEVREIKPNAEPADINWGLVYHRLKYSDAHKEQCCCAECKEYLKRIHEKYWA